MVSVAILSADQRLAFQIHQWMKEVADTVTWHVHADPAAFATKMETEVAEELIASSKGEALPDAEEMGSGKTKELADAYIRMVVVDLELLNSRGLEPVEWTTKLKITMAERSRSNPAFPTQFLFMAFEGGGFKIERLLQPVIDDVIIKPLDRSVFLQKIELATSDDPSIKPTYLFRQKTQLTIEIGKDASIDEIAESAFAIRNPFPLAPGVFASIHAPVLGAGPLARVICRSYKSEPHPLFPGQSLVRFGYFGLRSEQHNNVKKFMRERQPPSKHRAPPPPSADNDPAVPFNRVAVVDMNADIFSEIKSTIKDHYVGVSVTHYLSYARLLATLKQLYAVTAASVPGPVPSSVSAAPGAEMPVVAPSVVAALEAAGSIDLAAAVASAEGESIDSTVEAPPPRAWTTDGDLTFTVTAKEQELLKFETPLASGDLVLGRTRLEWAERPGDLLSGLDKLDGGELREMLDYAVSGGKGRSFLKLKDQVENIFYIEAQATLARAADGEFDAQVLLGFKEITQEMYQKHSSQFANAENKVTAEELNYDAIYIDVNLIRGDLQAWYSGFHEAFMKAGVIPPGAQMPKIILLADEKSKVEPEKYRSKLVSDFLFKPLDRKMLSYKAREIIDLIPRSESDIAAFVKCELPAKLAKDTVMEEVSEYGLSISHPTPFRRGATMRFFSPLFGSSADGVIARCTHCEERKVEKTVDYICHFIFFGAPDEILKKIRNWIREEYIHQKESGGS